MSITIGFYDLFSYTIPGILYLYIINEYLKLLNYPHVDINSVDNLIHAILIVIIAYIFGQLFDTISYRLPLITNKSDEMCAQTLKKVNQRHPEIQHKFTPDHWKNLLAMIRLKNPQIEERISSFNAISIMLRNLSLGILLFSLLQFTLFAVNSFTLQYLFIGIISLPFAWIASVRSRVFHEFYFSAIYETALHFGTSLEQVLKLSPPTPSNDSSTPELAALQPAPPFEPPTKS